MAVALNGYEVLLFHYDESEFQLSQTLSYKSKSQRQVSLATNHQYLVVGPADSPNEFQVLSYTEVQFEVIATATITSDSDEPISRVSISNDG